MNYLQTAKEYYQKQYPGDDVVPLGASEAEVRAIEQRLGIRFPEAHREFLLWMGNDINGIMGDSHCYLRDIESNTEELPGYFEDNGLPPIKKGSALCFYDYNGYACAWYSLPYASEDPDVYLLDECEPQVEPQFAGKYSEWILGSLRGRYLDTYRYLESRNKKSPNASTN